MSDLNSQTISPASLAELVAVAQKERWCVNLGCTTCGAFPFRSALKAVPRAEIIAGLRMMTAKFLAENSEMFRMIISEISILGGGWELLDALEGTPAEGKLRATIEYQRTMYEKRSAYIASQTPEAIAEKRAIRKAERLKATAPQRERKRATEEAVHSLLVQLEKTPTCEILSFLATQNSDVSFPAIGGLVYKRLAGYYQTESITLRDALFVSKLARQNLGYWKKLLERLVKRFLDFEPSLPPRFEQ